MYIKCKILIQKTEGDVVLKKWFAPGGLKKCEIESYYQDEDMEGKKIVCVCMNSGDSLCINCSINDFENELSKTELIYNHGN